MTLKEILAVSGQPGLFKVIASSRNGFIVENLESGKRTSVSSNNKVSSLGDIAIFTLGEDLPLGDALKAVREKQGGQPAISPKSTGDEIKAFFGSVLPDYDPARVYVSDMKKLISWYNILQAAGLLEVLDRTDDDEAAQEPEA